MNLPSQHLARCALLEVIALHECNFPSWFSDLTRVLQLTIPSSQWVSLLPHKQSSNKHIDSIVKAVNSACELFLLNEVNTSSKLDLLHNRLDRDNKKVWRPIALKFRHYLLVSKTEYRLALTHLLLSDHCLAIEQLH